MSTEENGTEPHRLNTPLQMRHDEIERLQEMLRSMPLGGRAAHVGGRAASNDEPTAKVTSRSGSHVISRQVPRDVDTRKATDPLNELKSDHFSAREEAVSKARHVFGEVILGKESEKTNTLAHDNANRGDFLPQLRRTSRGASQTGSEVTSKQVPHTEKLVGDYGSRFGDDILGRRPQQMAGGHHLKHTAPLEKGGERDVHVDDGTRANYILNELRTRCPLLSSTFTCSPSDATILMNAITGGGTYSERAHGFSEAGEGVEMLRGVGNDGNYCDAHQITVLEDRCATLEAEVRSLTTRLERKSDECDKLKDSVGEARQRAKAVEASAKQQQSLMAQRREESRKHLLTEEGRSAKLAHQNKLLQQELDKLKMRLSSALTK